MCRLALADTPAPYIVPMNFGFAEEKGQPVLYFHCAAVGRKLERIGSGAPAAFEMDTGHALLGAGENPCVYSYAYASVIGTGWIAPVENEAEKMAGLTAIMEQQTGKAFSFAGRELKGVTVLKLCIENLTAKRHRA